MKGVRRLAACLAPAFAAASFASGSAFAASQIVISQVYGGGGNTGAPYANDYIELFNRGTTSVSLDTMSLQYASATGTGNFGANSAQLTELSGSIGAGRHFLVKEAGGTTGAPLPAADLTDSTPINLSGSAGKIALVTGTTTLGCNGGSAPCTVAALARIVDLVGYGSANFYEGSAAAPTLDNGTGALRRASGCTDTDNNGADFEKLPPAPRNLSSSATPCGPASTNPSATGAANPASAEAGATTLLTVTVTPGTGPASTGLAVRGDLSSIGGSATQAFADDGANGDATAGDDVFSYRATVSAASSPGARSLPVAVTDAQARSASTSITFTVAAPPTITKIHDVQGSGDASPLVGQTVTVEGVVVGDLQLASQFNGFYLEEEDADADADPVTSEGIFVFGGGVDVNVGDVVRVTGAVSEFNGLTELSPASGAVSVRSTGARASVTPVAVSLPVASVGDLERYEGMRVSFSQTLTVDEVYNLGRFGEVSLSGAGRLYTPTAVANPGADAAAVSEQNARSRIVLDDANGTQNADPVLYPQGGLSATNTLRVGDSLAGLTGVLDYRFSAYRIQPVGAISFDHTNPRTAAPDAVGGNLRIGSFNVLNYFNGDGLGGGFPTSRGADSQFEFQRQRAKEISALQAMNADVVGLMELENDAGSTSAVADLVQGLNDAMGAGTYAYVDTGVIGTDEIKVALIYKPAAASPVGDWKILTSAVDPRFDTTKNRPSLAQTFRQNATGRRLTVVVNHLKSKGSSCGAGDDATDGSGNCNGTRTRAAAALVDWLKTDPTASGDPDFLLIGDMNAYTFETPITTFVDGGFANLVRTYDGLSAYSYVFNGESGYLDHALATSSLEAQIAGVGHWHINPDEPRVLDYNVEFKSPGQVDSFYSPGPYRASDHDPVVIGVQLAPAPTADAGGPYTVPEGGSTALAGSGTGTGLTYAWDLDGDGTFETTGRNPTYSAAGQDGPSTHVVTLKVSDGELSAVSTATVEVTNVPPTAAIGGAPATSPEGTRIDLTASSTDPGPDTVSYAWSVTRDGASFASGAGETFSYTPDDNGTYAATLTATDKDGGVGTATAATSVTNVAPTATFTASPSVFAGSPIALALSNPSDPSTADTAAGFRYAFDCGGGSFVGSATPTATCPTSDTGTPTVRGKITDKDGGSTIYSSSVTVLVTAASLCDLTTAYVTKEGVAHSLCVKLQHGSYGAYANEVAAQTGKSITVEQAATLTRLVSRL